MNKRPLPALIYRYDVQKFIILLFIALVIVGLLVAREYLYI